MSETNRPHALSLLISMQCSAALFMNSIRPDRSMLTTPVSRRSSRLSVSGGSVTTGEPGSRNSHYRFLGEIAGRLKF